MNGKPKDMWRDSLRCRQSAQQKRFCLPGVDGNDAIAVSHPQIIRSLEFITRNYDQPFNLAKLVQVSRMSRRGFVKAFRNHTGMRPGQMLRQFRIEQSKRLLIENDLRLKEIARLSGFRSLNSFCVTFRRLAGVAPKEFQRQEWLKSYKIYFK